jgi:hypothetical protein
MEWNEGRGHHIQCLAHLFGYEQAQWVGLEFITCELLKFSVGAADGFPQSTGISRKCFCSRIHDYNKWTWARAIIHKRCSVQKEQDRYYRLPVVVTRASKKASRKKP